MSARAQDLIMLLFSTVDDGHRFIVFGFKIAYERKCASRYDNSYCYHDGEKKNCFFRRQNRGWWEGEVEIYTTLFSYRGTA